MQDCIGTVASWIFAGMTQLPESILKIEIYVVDAFAREQFTGNPAAVCILDSWLDSWLDDQVLQCIAEENNLAETAFLVRNTDGGFSASLVHAKF